MASSADSSVVLPHTVRLNRLGTKLLIAYGVGFAFLVFSAVVFAFGTPRRPGFAAAVVLLALVMAAIPWRMRQRRVILEADRFGYNNGWRATRWIDRTRLVAAYAQETSLKPLVVVYQGGPGDQLSMLATRQLSSSQLDQLGALPQGRGPLDALILYTDFTHEAGAEALRSYFEAQRQV